MYENCGITKAVQIPRNRADHLAYADERGLRASGLLRRSIQRGEERTERIGGEGDGEMVWADR